jgi:hypothetical protein
MEESGSSTTNNNLLSCYQKNDSLFPTKNDMLATTPRNGPDNTQRLTCHIPEPNTHVSTTIDKPKTTPCNRESISGSVPKRCPAHSMTRAAKKVDMGRITTAANPS